MSSVSDVESAEREDVRARRRLERSAVRQHDSADLQVVTIEDVNDVVRQTAAQQRGELARAGRQHRERHLRAECRLLRAAHDLHVHRVDDQAAHLRRSVHLRLAGEADVVAEAEALRELQLRRFARREIGRSAEHRDAAGRAARVAAAFVRVRNAGFECALQHRSARACIDAHVASRLADERHLGRLLRFAHDRGLTRAGADARVRIATPGVDRVAGQLAHDLGQSDVLRHRAPRAQRAHDVPHLLRRSKAPRRIFLQRARHDLGDRRGNRRHDQMQRIGIVLHDGVEHRVHRIAFEGAAAGEQFVEDCAEGEEGSTKTFAGFRSR
jgi:hypothetical protein